jgi:serine/threonine-protein kinase
MPLASKLLADRYRVVGRLGAGGMAVVVLAEDEQLGRKVAVKRLHADSPEDAGRRFQREARLAASLNHPNIVAVYDIVTDEDAVLIVMEHVDGGTLRLEMDGGPMAPVRAIEVLCGVAAALDHAHEHGVVHRDVKPANVLIAHRDGTVKLTDFGIATAAERTNITRTGAVLGTAAYLAPERLDGNAGGPPSDVYATAAVAFEMLSGRKAVTGKTAMEVARRVIEAPPPDLADFVPGTPRRAAEALKRGMAKDPAERQATVGELVRELSAAYAEAAEVQPEPEPARAAPLRAPAPAAKPVPARTAPLRAPAPADKPAPARRRRGWLVPALLALAVVAVLAVVLLAGGDDEKAPRQASSKAAKQDQAQQPATSQPAEPSASAPAPAATPATPAPAGSSRSAPAKSLTGFYTRAANDDFNGAWALGTDNLHAQFSGSIATFRGTFATLQSISFPKLEVASESGDRASIQFSSVAKHTNRTDRCSGRASMVRTGGQWLVDHIGVNCTS